MLTHADALRKRDNINEPMISTVECCTTLIYCRPVFHSDVSWEKYYCPVCRKFVYMVAYGHHWNYDRAVNMENDNADLAALIRRGEIGRDIYEATP